ncbi:MAG: bacterioferritin [Proteobacteria bacterium]|nr:bacterioferritin [Pseudomonadota bacterium]
MSNKKVIDHLNVILGNELVAINQYFLHAKVLEDQGFNKLAAVAKAESIDEMKHADIIIERILFLNGTPNMDNYRKLKIGSEAKAMLKNDLDLEIAAIKDLNKAIEVAKEAQDVGTKDLLEKILISEETHLDFLQTQLDLIESLGLQIYLSTQI